jgi:hypothetical protein
MEIPKLDWSSADVNDGKLTVPVTGDRPKGWKATFERTVKLLGGSDWKAVKLKSGQVRVTGLQEGSEESLRHFLEGVVQQANASHQSDGEERQKGGEREQDTGERADGDARMADRLRNFGQ